MTKNSMIVIPFLKELYESAKHRAEWQAKEISSCEQMFSSTPPAKTYVYRWQQRTMEKGVGGLQYNATRPPGTPPAPAWKVREVVELTRFPLGGEATHQD